MDIEAIRRYCLQFPHTAENVQWGSDLCLKVDGKLFVVVALEAGPHRMSFKCTPEGFVELCERPGISPAPYLARAQWVSLERLNTLPDSELRELMAQSYRLVWERIPKKRRAELEEGPVGRKKKAGVAKAKSVSGKPSGKTKRTRAGP